MTIMYLADETTGECRGTYAADTVPAGMVDTKIAYEDGRQEWDGAAWIWPVAVLASIERDWRDYELLSSDFTQLPDSPFDAGEVTAWAAYRQALRDMTQLAGFPSGHTRPVAPI